MSPTRPPTALRIVAAALISAGHAGVLHARPEPPPAGEVRDFDVAVGDLGAVLTGIGAAAGRPIAFPARLTRGLRAGPVRGRMTPRAALERALEGTGLVPVGGDAGPITVRDAPPAAGRDPVGGPPPDRAAPRPGRADLDLPDIDVVGERARFSDRGFQAGDAGQTTRLGDAPAREVPIAVTSVTSGLLRSQAATSPVQALENVSGVTVAPTSIGFNAFTIRGFNTNSPFVDGDPSAGSLYARVPIDGLERIDVLKGPTSLLSGVTQEGGLVDLVTKAPTDRTVREVTARLGSFGYRTLALDLGGAVPRTEGLTYRLNLSGNAAGTSYAGYSTPHERYVAPAVRWQDRDLDVSIGGRYADVKSALPNFTFAPNGQAADDTSIVRLPRGVPQDGAGRSLVSRGVALHSDQGAGLVRSGAFDLSAHNHVQYQTQRSVEDFFGWNQASYDGLNSLTPVQAAARTADVAERVDLTGVYRAEGLRQTAKVGYDLLVQRAVLASDTGAPSLVDPATGLPRSAADADAGPAFQRVGQLSSVSGFYYLDKLDTLDDRLHVVGSVRNDRFSTTITSSNLSVPNGLTQYGLSWIAGGAFDVAPWLSIYGNRSNGFVPQFAISETLGVPPPQRRDGSEIGVRAYLFDKRLSLTASVFALRQTNVAVFNPADLTATTALIVPGEASRGVEFEAQGEVFDGLNVVLAVADIHASYQNQLDVGVLQAAPRFTGSLWTTYTLQRGSLAGLTFGLGVHGDSASATAARPVDLDTASPAGSSLPLPGYVVADAKIAYKRGDYDVALKLNNLTNRYFLYPAITSDQIVIGEGRNFLLEVRRSF